MQKSFIAIALALTLSSAVAYSVVNTTAFVKVPTLVVDNTNTTFTNASNLDLISINAGELDLWAAGYAKNDQNASAGTYTAAWKKLDGKTLAATVNSSGTFQGSRTFITIINGIALTISHENDTNAIPQVIIYQSSITGGAAVNRIVASSNTNNTYKPTAIGLGAISKTVYVFYTAASTGDNSVKVNVTNFVAGGAKGSLEFTLTTAYNTTVGASKLSVVWGESLGSSQLFANWQEGTALKDATIDVSKGTVTANAVGGFNLGYNCQAYATDKKWFGDLCTTTVNQTQSIYVRSNTTSLALLTTNNGTLNQLTLVVPYGPYIAIFYSDSISTAGNTTYSYEIWNIDTNAAFRNKTTYITADYAVGLYRVTSAGLYTFTYSTNVKVDNATYAFQNVQVGLLLGSSYLTSVLGFIMTIVAGLLLF